MKRLLTSLLFAVFFCVFPQTVSGFSRCSNHRDGVCVDMYRYRCKAGYKQSYSGCGFTEICCYSQSSAPKTTPKPLSRVTYQPNTNSTCGKPDVNFNTKVVGGTRVDIKQFPWQVSIQVFNQHICGGSLVSDQWILTAAHCTQSDQVQLGLSDFRVLIGSTTSKNYYRSQVHRLSNVLYHTGYGRAAGYDIAMLKLDKPIDLKGSSAKAICLPSPGEKFSGSVCAATGWGALHEPVGKATSKDTSKYLYEVDMPIVDKQKCQYYMGYVANKVICAGNIAGGKDTCQGDSGGPLACKRSDGSWVLAGIVSNGVGCARRNMYGMYTEVSAYDSWIQSVMQKF